MAKGQHLTSYQQKIVKRYYDNKDTITLNRLSELVSDLYLADSEKKKDQLWKRVAQSLASAQVKPEDIADIVEKRDLEALAKLVSKLGE